MGDDLNFAQKFTRTAADGLAVIAEMEDPRASGDSAIVADMMTTLQRGAKRLRARSIYSSAQDVLSALHHEDNAILIGRIQSLGSLVTEYAKGLDELLQTTEVVPEKTRPEKWELARETLNALLPSARPEDADMLSRLMRAPVTLETVKPETASPDLDVDLDIDLGAQINVDLEAAIVPFIRTEAIETLSESPATLSESSAEAPSEQKLAPVLPEAPPMDDSPVVALDAMMREVIAEALSVARSVNRTISLSYDMGERVITELRANELRGRLGNALSQIIRQSLTEDRVGHIDVNLAGEQLHIMAGTTALRVAIDPANAPAATESLETEMEQGLSAKLVSLMDPASLRGSAS